MYTTHLTLAGKYLYLLEDITLALEFLRRSDLQDLQTGTVVTLRTPSFCAYVQELTTEPYENRYFETHEKHFDIHYVLSGTELFGYAPMGSLLPKDSYDAEKDLAFYHEPEQSSLVIVPSGNFILFSPEDAHKSCCAVNSPEAIKKIVIKVPLEK